MWLEGIHSYLLEQEMRQQVDRIEKAADRYSRWYAASPSDQPQADTRSGAFSYGGAILGGVLALALGHWCQPLALALMGALTGGVVVRSLNRRPT
ncbi:MAG TPA: hypothetical protein GX513_10155 [Firmicutes bacterium]|nr:hypothetical protein [Bacillota bacterium]